MLVRDALVPSPLVVSTDTSLFELIDLILGGNQTTAAVVENGLLVGIISGQDVFEPLLPSYLAMDATLVSVLREDYFEEVLGKLRNIKVGDAMECEVHTVAPDAPVMEAVSLFLREGLKTVPVVDGKRYVGSVTRRSVLRIIRNCVAE
ncbi:MAG: CBS domain-containing protein [Planctomycetes bacterium]|nr:CBS domain-containing protein [Planctomycetota bacterium]